MLKDDYINGEYTRNYIHILANRTYLLLLFFMWGLCSDSLSLLQKKGKLELIQDTHYLQ